MYNTYIFLLVAEIHPAERKSYNLVPFTTFYNQFVYLGDIMMETLLHLGLSNPVSAV